MDMHTFPMDQCTLIQSHSRNIIHTESWNLGQLEIPNCSRKEKEVSAKVWSLKREIQMILLFGRNPNLENLSGTVLGAMEDLVRCLFPFFFDSSLQDGT